MERFWSKVEIRGPDECWPWKAYCNKQGYGQYQFGTKKKRAHRVAYTYMVGEIPEGLCVLHRCDNPSCVNPKHLWIGTEGDNNRDARAKGRVGKTGPKRRFTKEEAQKVKDEHVPWKMSISMLAKEIWGDGRMHWSRIVWDESI